MAHLGAIRGAQGDPLDLLRQRVQQVQAVLHPPLAVRVDGDAHIVVLTVLPELRHASGHGLAHIALPRGLDDSEMPGHAAGGQGAGHPVWLVIQLLHHLQHPPPDLLLHIRPVVEHPVHRADGDARPFCDHLDRCPHVPSLPFSGPSAGHLGFLEKNVYKTLDLCYTRGRMVRPSVSAGGRPPAVGAPRGVPLPGPRLRFSITKCASRSNCFSALFYTVPQYFTGAERRSASVK